MLIIWLWLQNFQYPARKTRTKRMDDYVDYTSWKYQLLDRLAIAIFCYILEFHRVLSVSLHYWQPLVPTKHKQLFTKRRWSIKTRQKHTTRTCGPYPISNDWSFPRWFAISRGTNAEQLTMIRGPDVETWSKGLRSKLRYNTSITAVFERFQAPEYDWHIISLGGNGGWCYYVRRGNSGGPLAHLSDYVCHTDKYIQICKRTPHLKNVIIANVFNLFLWH